MKSDIMSISRLRMATDGEGVSTLVAFFDCPLHCKYCINEYCHKKTMFKNKARAIYTPKELVDILKQDEIYYLMTGGGVVFGGGEPLLQSAFIHEVCQLIDPRWKKRIETSLNVPWELVEPLIGDIDEWIIDIKDMDPDIYELYTEKDNKNVIDNLLKICTLVFPEQLRIRIPYIKNYNDEKDVERSIDWVMENLNVIPDVFHYMFLPHTNEKHWREEESEPREDPKPVYKKEEKDPRLKTKLERRKEKREARREAQAQRNQTKNLF